METPYFVIDKLKLDTCITSLRRALDASWANNIVGYSYKTNALPWLLSYFNSKGLYAEVVSEDEYGLGKLIGVKDNRFIYNGPIKTRNTFVEAVRNGCYVNIDSQRELGWLEELSEGSYKLGVRVNFDIERYCPGQSQCGAEGGRFGFCYENGEFGKAVKKIKDRGINIAGIHLHTSSKTRGLDIYRTIAAVACEIEDKYGLGLSYIDVGGGFFGGLETKPQFDEYISLISKVLSAKFSPEKTSLIVEPGMAVIGAAVSYVTTVIDVKDTSYSRFVVTDGSRINIDPQMKKNSYYHRYERRGERGVLSKQVICGCTCMENDRLFTAFDEPELTVGDLIIYEKVGAYTMCLSPLFIKYFPSVYLKEGEACSEIRGQWTPQMYIQGSRY